MTSASMFSEPSAVGSNAPILLFSSLFISCKYIGVGSYEFAIPLMIM